MGKLNPEVKPRVAQRLHIFISDVYGEVFKWSVKKINEQSCESSSRSTSGSQLLVGTTKLQDFVWEMYVNQAL